MRTSVLTVTFLALVGAVAIGQTPQRLPSGTSPPPPAQQGQAPAAPQRQSRTVPDAQMPPVTFRAEVNYVEVDAVVRDASGRFVPDLTKEDFQVFEDGKPQAVTAFSLVRIPIERDDRPLFMTRQVEPDVYSNVGRPEGRLYVIVLDDLHTDFRRSTRVRQAARRFIERNLGANDLAAVLLVSGRTSQDFTNNRRLLVEAVDQFMGRKLRSPTLEKMDEYTRTRLLRQAGDPLKDPTEFERAYNARSLLSTVKNLADWLSGIHGRRKAVVLVSEGIDYDIYDFMNNADASTILDSTRDVIASATRGNVQLYTIDPRGLATMGDEQMEMQAPITDDAEASKLGVSSLFGELRLAQDSLRVLAEETGGFAAVNSNEFESAFSRMVEENSTYYVLGYHPSNDKRDGRYRRIEVRVARPGLEVRARKGYVAPKGRPPPRGVVPARARPAAPPRRALESPIQVTGLGMAATAAPFRGPGNAAAVALIVQLDPGTFAFKEKDGKLANTLEVSYVVVDQTGKVKAGNRETVTMGLKPETFKRFMQAGLRVQSRFEAPPGRYQVRVAATESGGSVGTVLVELLVPDFTAEPLTMSGLIVSSAYARAVPTTGDVAEIKDVLPGPPTTARNFAHADELAVLTEIYDNRGDQPHSVDIVASLLDQSGRTAFSLSERRSSRELGGRRGGYGYTARIPLKDLAPGQYVLRIDARSSLKDGGSASRETLIRILP
ncbi:MAG: VWA domain-containing protein [Acidobacteriota bacterium]